MTVTLALILAALIQVESSGRDGAIGDNGAAVGCLQIQKVMVDDVNRILGRDHFTYDDRYRRSASMGMALVAFSHYVTEERLGRRPTVRDYCRRWNPRCSERYIVAVIDEVKKLQGEGVDDG